MSKKIFIVFLLFIFSCTVYATGLKDLQQDEKNVLQNINQAKKLLEQYKGEKDSLELDILELDAKLGDVSEELSNIENELNIIIEFLDKTTANLEAVKTEKKNQEIILKERLRNIYEYGNSAYLDVLFSSKDINEFIKKAEYISKVFEYDQNIFNKLKEKEREVERKVEEIEKHKIQYKILSKQQEVKQEIINMSILEKQKLIEESEFYAEKYANEVKKYEDEAKEIKKQIIEEEIRLAQLAKENQDAKDALSYTGGKLGWPVPGITKLSSYFGKRIDPFSKKETTHYGIDIPAPVGTKIVAAESGVVIRANYSSSYGYVVIISHGSGLNTLYAHNSKLLVKADDIVSRGDEIALAGSTGFSTGPHLHFETLINGVRKDPMPFLKK